jgi:hypothetical protein
MTVREIEQRLIELKHRDPFVPFAVEMADGQSVQCFHPCLAINETGAGFFGPDGGIVDIDFRNVRSIRQLTSEATA